MQAHDDQIAGAQLARQRFDLPAGFAAFVFAHPQAQVLAGDFQSRRDSGGHVILRGEVFDRGRNIQRALPVLDDANLITVADFAGLLCDDQRLCVRRIAGADVLRSDLRAV